ncbi:MAG: GIY-YIG nuclease family protein [Archaeoglobaceae archaeon]|nr:GIY-YIG nuclease family protein [Archaeoglobaceae archaeon]MDW8118542.1 GIY-YIG nuclease family protein [Archaeoglobaceae archaeon]
MASYILVLYNDRKQKIEVGKLGFFEFEPGYYYYVGSAEKISRVRRHFGRKRKKWHIDYISEVFDVLGAILLNFEECELAKKVKLTPIKGFGCSDCDCYSHLFYSRNFTIEYLLT